MNRKLKFGILIAMGVLSIAVTAVARNRTDMAFVTRFIDGFTFAPAISFQNDTDTGIMRSDAGFVSFVSNGTIVGGFNANGPIAPVGLTVGDPALGTKIVTMWKCDADNLAIGAGADTVQVNATATCTGAALGDLCLVGVSADDAALDDAVLSCFVESANTVKVQANCDVTGCDMADTNDYNIFLIRF